MKLVYLLCVSSDKCPPGDTCVIVRFDPSTPIKDPSMKAENSEDPRMSTGEDDPAKNQQPEQEDQENDEQD